MPASGHRDDCGAERYEPDAKTEVNWQGQEAGDDAEDTDCGKLSVHVTFLVGVRERLRGASVRGANNSRTPENVNILP
ncbi:hypothetical protein A2708_00065 [Candidatus Saccharibacteria bacterium RIFCSPHIGHO2_01_FULL_49_21]|nr:MAG: hypothetical protein A2708_00065 [Candidatus Saccharibacteria bacterium RIFCSPHIGHO2_01_FULL_49_21]